MILATTALSQLMVWTAVSGNSSPSGMVGIPINLMGQEHDGKLGCAFEQEELFGCMGLFHLGVGMIL